MTKLTIEIEDIADKEACVLALRKLSAAFAAQYGEREASRILRFYSDPMDPKRIAEHELWKARRDLPHLEPHDLRLVLEYFAMPKLSKRGLAKELARRNAALKETWKAWTAERRILEAQPLEAQRVSPPWPKPPPAPPYGPKGTTNWRRY